MGFGVTDAARAHARVETIYRHARTALYATLDQAVIHDAAARPLLVRTAAIDRDEYLAAPPSGERLREDDAHAVASLYGLRRPQVQLVVSDGLNANALKNSSASSSPACATR